MFFGCSTSENFGIVSSFVVNIEYAEERSSEDAMSGWGRGGGAQRPVLRVNEPQNTGAQRGQNLENLLVNYK
jgi:hypothetical protein